MSNKAALTTFIENHFPATARTMLQKIESYHQWLLEENEKVNLISRKTDPEDIWTQHFLDSILSIDCVDFKAKNILDVGTGGGFPGIPLAILFPDAHVTLLDSTRKKGPN